MVEFKAKFATYQAIAIHIKMFLLKRQSYRIFVPRSKHSHVLCDGHKITHPSRSWCTNEGHPLDSLYSRHTSGLSF